MAAQGDVIGDNDEDVTWSWGVVVARPIFSAPETFLFHIYFSYLITSPYFWLCYLGLLSYRLIIYFLKNVKLVKNMVSLNLEKISDLTIT